MAYYAALLSTVELLEDILHPHRFPNSFVGCTHTFKSLHKKFSQLLSSLQSYSSTSCNDDPLEERIRDASYQALDLIESQILEHRKILVRLLISLCPQLERFVWKVKLQKVGKEVDSIVQQLTAIKQSQKHEHVAATSEQQQQSAPMDVGTRVVGFEDQLLEIKEKLCALSPQLQVIPIVGMGGIGKTTLARHTFHDPLIVTKFDFRGWVTVSQDYHVLRVLHNIVKSLGIIGMLPDESSGVKDEATVKEREREQERALKDGIHKYLKWRKFLIIVDDIWNTQVWDDIKHIFPNDCNGSRIVLTTRLGDMAEYASCADSVHHMQFLNDDASWTLLQEKAFAKDPCPLELVNIGKCIASKCGGLPIAIVVVGGILSNDKTLEHWKNVAWNVRLALSKDDEHLSNILSLSYNHLPHHLKPCFLYLGSFPEDHEINVSKLIKLWIAESFLKAVSKSKNLEEIGGDYFEDLVNRNLVIITKRKASGKFKSCVMHDVLRDFCRRKGLDEHAFPVTDRERHPRTNGMENVRRIFVHGMPRVGAYDGNREYVHSIIHFGRGSKWDRVSISRILDVTNLSTSFVMSTVSKMSHLKYLAIRPDHQRECCIDASISNLHNLETLIIISRFYNNISLPPEIWKMSWLKYLIIDGMTLSPVPPYAPLRKLEYLHTLQTPKCFIVTEEVTQMIPNVRKLKLVSKGIEGKSLDDLWKLYGLNNLLNLLQLETLDILFYNMNFIRARDFLSQSGFGFPQYLKKLSLNGCQLPWEAMTVVGCLKYLQVLKLRHRAFMGDVWEPVEGEFQELKFLLLELLDLKQWRAETTHFPKLQCLKINCCFDLKEIPLDLGDIGTLKFLTVNDSMYAGDSAKRIQEEQQELGNYALQVIVQ